MQMAQTTLYDLFDLSVLSVFSVVNLNWLILLRRFFWFGHSRTFSDINLPSATSRAEYANEDVKQRRRRTAGPRNNNAGAAASGAETSACIIGRAGVFVGCQLFSKDGKLAFPDGTTMRIISASLGRRSSNWE
jgi:hypothetical protein